ncbi:MAG: (Na+)-NQR maturation NqrM [Proteobacteria bacterium]|nr:(Na+)-NQR maturation NqrM [Pseudomonadota bacterium]
MQTFIAAFVIFSLTVVAMSVGVMLGKRAIQGSCGGGKTGEEAAACDFCERKEECRQI